MNIFLIFLFSNLALSQNLQSVSYMTRFEKCVAKFRPGKLTVEQIQNGFNLRFMGKVASKKSGMEMYELSEEDLKKHASVYKAESDKVLKNFNEVSLPDGKLWEESRKHFRRDALLKIQNYSAVLSYIATKNTIALAADMDGIKLNPECLRYAQVLESPSKTQEEAKKIRDIKCGSDDPCQKRFKIWQPDDLVLTYGWSDCVFKHHIPDSWKEPAFFKEAISLLEKELTEVKCVELQ